MERRGSQMLARWTVPRARIGAQRMELEISAGSMVTGLDIEFLLVQY